jgi:UDP-2,3-diacylglucosamine pyrophosphatase LpxH
MTLTPQKLYLISDLHLGGDGLLMNCDYPAEMVDFLRSLESESPDTELLLIGDTFGFWELTNVHGPEKLDEVIRHHAEIFDQFKRTGEKIVITMMVGNHDYDLACDPVYAEKLRKYNIRLDTSVHITREIGGKKVWIEHGQQVDQFNASPDYGNQYAQPVGFFITETLVGGASKVSVFGSTDWLKDIRSVDIRQLPDWLISNYFYREMHVIIRFLLVPFLLLLTVTFLALGAHLLKKLNIFDANIFLNNSLFDALGFVGDVVVMVLVVSMIFWFFIFIVSIPLFFILRDIRGTLRRMQILPQDKNAPLYVPTAGYDERADEIFEADPEVAAYVFGHTHDAFLKQSEGRTMINTGTWLKLLTRVPVIFGYLPAVYVPQFRLNYFLIQQIEGKVVADYVFIPKEPGKELTLLQRFFILGRRPKPPEPIPSRTVL